MTCGYNQNRNRNVAQKARINPASAGLVGLSWKNNFAAMAVKMIEPPVTIGYSTDAGRFAAPISWRKYDAPLNAEPRNMIKSIKRVDFVLGFAFFSTDSPPFERRAMTIITIVDITKLNPLVNITNLSEATVANAVST